MESAFCPADAIKADADFRLIETFFYRPGLGARDLDRHLSRMARSAAAFAIPFDRSAAQALVQQLAGEGDLRCRLTLSAEGKPELTSAPLPPVAARWNVSLAKQRVRSDDPWLRYKTTRRQLYDQARAALSAGVDELLFLNERGEACEGTITNLFLTLPDGTTVTPPLASGVLPGVLRQSLLATGAWREAVVTLDDLRNAKAVQMGNSLRGLIACELAL